MGNLLHDNVDRYLRWLDWWIPHRWGWAAREGYDLEDLKQEGWLGLETAMKRFDPSRGCAFVTYAQHYVDHRIRRHIGRFCSPLSTVGSCFYYQSADVDRAKASEYWEPKDLDTLPCQKVRDPSYWVRVALDVKTIERRIENLLTTRQKTILSMTVEGFTLRDISKEVGVTYQRVQQIQVNIRRILSVGYRHRLDRTTIK